MNFTAPEVPQAGERYMPESTETFAGGLAYILKTAIANSRPDISDAAGVCLTIIGIVILISIISAYTDTHISIIELAGVVSVSILIFSSANSMIHLGTQTVSEVSDYGKLFLPVLTGALAAQGGTATSAALYGGTVFFNALLATVISKCLIPLIYVYLSISIVSRATNEEMLGNLRSLSSKTATWCLKTILYVFTGYMTITGAVSGTTDAAALKAAKLTISGSVPVVGNILSDASEAVVVSAGVLKNAAGIYGLLAILSICIGPFIKIGIQYLMLKLTAAFCQMAGSKQTVGVLQDFASAMGLILAMVGTVCLLLLISTVCFMKGVG